MRIGRILLAAALLLGLMLQPAQAANPVVVMETNMGTMMIMLDEAAAPKTVANFLKYVDSGFYDGTVFHRVISGFMIQGGGFDMTLRQKPTGTPIANEADNGLENKRGTIAMARTGDPHSATAQFFINHADNAFLNYKSKTPQGWGYAVFGKVIRGLDVVDKIAAVETGRRAGMSDVPKEAVVITKAYRHQG